MRNLRSDRSLVRSLFIILDLQRTFLQEEGKLDLHGMKQQNTMAHVCIVYTLNNVLWDFLFLILYEYFLTEQHSIRC